MRRSCRSLDDWPIGCAAWSAGRVQVLRDRARRGRRARRARGRAHARVPRPPPALPGPRAADSARAPRDDARPRARRCSGRCSRDAQLLARAVEQGLGAEGSFVAVNNRVSQSVPHLHVHVVPRRRKDGLRGFFWPRTLPRRGARARSQARLRAAVAASGTAGPGAAAAKKGAYEHRTARRAMAVEQALQEFRETETGESFSLQNQQPAEGRAGRRDDPGQARLDGRLPGRGQVRARRHRRAGPR